MTTLALLLACALPKPDTGGDDTAGPVIPDDCDAVTGTGSVALVWRADPSVLVPPADTPTGETAAFGFAGPDGLGRYYLSEPTGVLKRSDDGGCTWVAVGLLPNGYTGTDTGWEPDTGGGPRYSYWELYTGPHADRVYAFSYLDSRLLWSADGVEWAEAGAVTLYSPGSLVLDPADATRLRGYGPDGIVTSTDGGATWSAVATPEVEGWYNVGIDPADLDRIALGRRGLWVTTDGATWQARPFDGGPLPAWDAGALYALHYGASDALLHLSRSDDLGVTFTDLPIEADPHDSVHELFVEGGLAVTGGYRYDAGSGVPPAGLVQLTTEAGTVTHTREGYDGLAGVGFGADRVVVAFEGPYLWSPD